MRSVPRSPEPDFFADLRTAHARWDSLDGADRNRIRDELARDFVRVCAYCEQPCQSPTRNAEPNEESIDHFRPRNRFPAQWLEWLNLVYACRRCNQAKGGKWPGFDDDSVNRMLAAEDARYSPAPRYVNPSVVEGQRPANGFFEFNAATGEMLPAPELNPEEWSIARRTIQDIDLNDSGLGANDWRHLWNRRMAQRNLLVTRLNMLEDFDMKVTIMMEFVLPDKPFASFIRAYIRDRFPIFREFLR